MKKDLIELLLDKLNVSAFSMACGLILICGGIYMCFSELSIEGAINIKAVFLEGKIETGSLGLLSMFLGTLIVLALVLGHRYKGQEVKFVLNGNEIIAKSLSYKKLREVIQAVTTKEQVKGIGDLPSETPNDRFERDAEKKRRAPQGER